MIDRTPEREAETRLDELAARTTPAAFQHVGAQFESRLADLRHSGHLGTDVTDRLELFWQLLQAPDDVVPFGAKALVMAAITYVVSPVDAIPDGLGRVGYLDDAMVVRMAARRLEPEIAAYRSHAARR